MRKHLSWAGQAVAWSVIVAVSAALLVVLLGPRVAGATPYTVLTSSMEPDLPAGTLAVVKPAAIEDIETGSVITYQLRSGRPEVVTHRVVALGVNADGEVVVQTQGDANASPDRAWVREVQLKGELWYAVPYLGHVNSLLTGGQRQWAVYIVAALLLAYAVLTWAGVLRDRRRNRTSVNEEVDDETPAPTPAQWPRPRAA